METKQNTESTYAIIRYTYQAPNELVQSGLTLAEAQEWCSRADTHGEDWFDGYIEE